MTLIIGARRQRVQQRRRHAVHSEHSSSSGVHGLVAELDKSADVSGHDDGVINHEAGGDSEGHPSTTTGCSLQYMSTLLLVALRRRVSKAYIPAPQHSQFQKK